MELPAALRVAIDIELREVTSKDVVMAARDLSRRYRDAGGSPDTLLRSELDVVAYAAYRLPATFAAVRAVLDEVRERRPEGAPKVGLRPKTLLDVGAGPGTAAWAAMEVWPEIERVVMLERDPRMNRIGQALAGYSHSEAIRHAEWTQADATDTWEFGGADLAIAGYCMGELPVESHAGFVRTLWKHTADTCLIVEPGTPRGFAVVRKAGDELVKAGAHIVAPFPQDWDCLDSEDDWCHFSQRVGRTRMHRAAKHGTLSFEDEKYSYVVASRHTGVPIAARVIRQPQVRSGHIRLVLCTAGGVKHVVVTRSRQEAFRRAKDLAWGSAIPIEDASFYGL
jgi:ribosomal protein RSM22 (predicted rRNA methylase)